jgi:signal peptidase II
MRKWIYTVAILIAVDQITKKIAEELLEFGEAIAVLPYLNFRLVYNKGAAFSFLSEAGGWQRWFFVGLATSVCAYILYWLSTLKPNEQLTKLSLVFVLSGALGNLIDRILFAKVTDFIDVYYPSSDACIFFFFHLPSNTCHWPTFNIADILITIGASLLFIDLIRSKSSQ